MISRMRMIQVGVLLSLVAGSFWLHSRLEACASTEVPIYVHKLHPDHGRFDAFARGELGLLQPTFARSYLVVAYRHLTGLGMDATAQQGALDLWWERQGLGPEQKNAAVKKGWDDHVYLGRERWDHVREQVSKSPQVPRGNWDSTSPEPGASAYEYAADTLTLRLKDHKTEEPLLVSWIQGQDAVFDRSANRALPEDAEVSAPLWFKQDRAYQKAAALYYTGKYEVAARAFEDIASDPATPHRFHARYLAAKMWSIVGAGDLAKKAAFDKAMQACRGMEADARLAEAAADLRDHITFLRDPEAYFHDLALRLGAGKNLSDFRRMLDNYTYAWDQLSEQGDSASASAAQERGLPAEDDLTQWILTFQTGTDAVEAYTAHPRLPQLVAALAWVKAGEASVPKLLSAAEQVKADSPAFLTLQYHVVRLLVDMGRKDEATAHLAKLEAIKDPPVSFVNALRLLDRSLAKDIPSYLAKLPMTEAGEQTDGMGASHAPWGKDAAQPELAGGDLHALQTQVPLEQLVAAASSPSTPKVLKVPRIAFEKALWLDRMDALRTLELVIPEEKELIRLMIEARDREERRFVLGLREGRVRNKVGYPSSAHDIEMVPVLSKGEREAAEAEQVSIETLGNPVAFHCRNVLAYAKGHPEDPRVPEALHQVIQLTRNNYDETGGISDLSKRCFLLLHHSYPDSEWTRKTKYHY